jgi:hypothetical protein
MKLKFAAAAILACAAFSASAADQTFTIEAGKTFDFNGLASLNDGLLSGGTDVLSFTGLAAGSYNAVLTFSGNFVDVTSASLNGLAPQTLINYAPISLGAFNVSTTSPFTLTLNGTADPAGLASYSGHITVTAVPEPETYGMLLGGLGLLGLVARRKKNQA